IYSRPIPVSTSAVVSSFGIASTRTAAWDPMVQGNSRSRKQELVLTVEELVERSRRGTGREGAINLWGDIAGSNTTGRQEGSRGKTA
ncbi:hypothetical protein LTR96_011859, partial [Exophiala xenobiotica]